MTLAVVHEHKYEEWGDHGPLDYGDELASWCPGCGRGKLEIEADLKDPAVIRHFDRVQQWPRNKMRVYRDPYEELILVQWHSQWRIRNAYRRAAERLQPDAAARVTVLADHHVLTLGVLRDVLREGRAG